MSWIASCTFGLLVAATVWLTAHTQQVAAGRVRTVDRFQGVTVLQTPDGTQPVRVTIQNWSFGGGLKIDELKLPLRGTVVVHLRGGELTTVINGKRERRQEGDYWTVDPGVSMGIETGDDSATIQTVLVGEP